MPAQVRQKFPRRLRRKMLEYDAANETLATSGG